MFSSLFYFARASTNIAKYELVYEQTTKQSSPFDRQNYWSFCIFHTDEKKRPSYSCFILKRIKFQILTFANFGLQLLI